MRRLCTICARGGSKGLKSKNVRPLLGKPLLAHSVAHAVESGLFEEIAVSSDSSEILDAASRAGVRWLIRRPPELATDESDKGPAIVHCAREVERSTGKAFDTFVDLDATAPLRLARHVREAVELVESGGADNVFSACRSRRSPYFNMVELGPDGSPRLCKPVDPPIVRRQDAPATYDMNASIYAWRRKAFFESEAGVLLSNTRMLLMPESTVFDIDSELDFELVEGLIGRLKEGGDG